MNIIIPLASNQRDVWYDQATYPNSPVYNIGGYLCIEGEINLNLLEKATNQLVAESDALRLTIYQENENILQSVTNKNTVTLEFVDFSTTENPNLSSHEWLEHTFQQPFLLEQKKKLVAACAHQRKCRALLSTDQIPSYYGRWLDYKNSHCPFSRALQCVIAKSSKHKCSATKLC